MPWHRQTGRAGQTRCPQADASSPWGAHVQGLVTAARVSRRSWPGDGGRLLEGHVRIANGSYRWRSVRTITAGRGRATGAAGRLVNHGQQWQNGTARGGRNSRAPRAAGPTGTAAGSTRSSHRPNWAPQAAQFCYQSTSEQAVTADRQPNRLLLPSQLSNLNHSFWIPEWKTEPRAAGHAMPRTRQKAGESRSAFPAATGAHSRAEPGRPLLQARQGVPLLPASGRRTASLFDRGVLHSGLDGMPA